MTPAARRLLVGLPLGLAALLALAAMAALPEFGASVPALGERLAEVALEERHLANLSTAIIFDLRALDTLGEQFVIFAVVIGVALLFRDVSTYPGGEPLKIAPLLTRPVPRSPGTAAAARLLLPLLIVFGTYVTLHAHLGTGGGFQGGALLASAMLLVYLGAGERHWRIATPPAPLEIVKSASALAFVGTGLLGLLAGGSFLENVLPLGAPGRLASGGTVPVLNAAAGIGVASGLLLLFREYLAELGPEAREEAPQ